jgi:hypothetical protein
MNQQVIQETKAHRMKFEIHTRYSAIELSRRLIWLGSIIWILSSPL